MSIKRKFGEQIVKLRKRNSLSEEKIAKDLGITQQSLNLYENGKRSPNLEMICKLAEYFNISLDYLVGRIDNSDER
ncbi:hypothetical protein FACS189499_07630 [Clostridia bacterium]|nr:hypothetical protein FACS189499_07630 [Clostridia bacterium]